MVSHDTIVSDSIEGFSKVNETKVYWSIPFSGIILSPDIPLNLFLG